MDKPFIGSVWLHAKTGKEYLVLHNATHTETQEALVVYGPKSSPYEKVWVRPLSMFMDGRFKAAG